MTTRVLGIHLRDAGRDGVYRVDPDDPVTLIDDAARAGLPVTRADLSDCRDESTLRRHIAEAAGLIDADASWQALDDALRADARSGLVLLFDHADAMCRAAPASYAAARDALQGMARQWHARGVPFFVFLTFPDNETRDAAIDA